MPRHAVHKAAFKPREHEARKAKRTCVWVLDCSSPRSKRRSLTNGKSPKCLF